MTSLAIFASPAKNDFVVSRLELPLGRGSQFFLDVFFFFE